MRPWCPTTAMCLAELVATSQPVSGPCPCRAAFHKRQIWLAVGARRYPLNWLSHAAPFGATMTMKQRLKIRFTVHGDPCSGDEWRVDAVSDAPDSEGEVVAFASFCGASYVEKHGGLKGSDSASWVEVQERYRRLGLATAIYDYAEKVSGRKLVPWAMVDGGLDPMEPDGRRFWSARGSYRFNRDGSLKRIGTMQAGPRNWCPAHALARP